MFESPLIEKFDAWVTPLFLTTYPEHLFLKKQLIDIVYAERAESIQADTDFNTESNINAIASGIAKTAKKSLYESTLDFLEKDDEVIQSIKIFLADLVLMVAADANQNVWPEDAEVEVIITEAWSHITQNGGYHDVHSHPNCSWCGIYYLDVGDSNFANRNGVNRFYDPRINAEHYLDAGSSYLNGEGVWDIEPSEGQVVIFPSYLKHSALPYFGKTDRVVIAFNCQVHF